MSESLNLSGVKHTGQTLVNRKSGVRGRTHTKSRRPKWQQLLEDIVNVNHNNRAEIFQYLLDKLNKHKSYFFCGFDLFYLNNFNSTLIDSELQTGLAFSSPEARREQIGRAIRWLAKPHAVKPGRANIYAFVAFLLKNNSISKKRQVVVVQGERASGKSSQMAGVLEFFRFLGKTEFLRQRTLDPEQVWDFSGAPRQPRKCSESKPASLAPPEARRTRAISQNKKPKILSRLREETLRVNVLHNKASPQEEKRFASEENVDLLEKGLRALALFTSSVNPQNRRTSNATVVMKLKIDEQEDGCLIRRGFFQLNFFLSQALENKWLGGFESFYAFLAAEDETFLNAYGVQKKLQANPGLYFDSFLKTHAPKLARHWVEIQGLFPPKLLRQLQKAMCATLILVNVQAAAVTKETQYLAILLDVPRAKLEEYFRFPAEKELSLREKIKYLKTKGRRAAVVLYRAVLDLVVAFFNVQMFEVFRVSSSAEEFATRNDFDLEFIDFLGYIDYSHAAPRPGKAKAKQENGSYEFVTNWLNEKMYQLYCRQKFSSPRKNDREIAFVRNDDVLAKIEGLFKTLTRHSDYARAADEVGKEHLVFLKKAMNFLGQSGVRATDLGGDEHYLDFSHFFAESVNYDLRSLHQLTRPQPRDVDFFWAEVLSEAAGLLLPQNWALGDVLISQYAALKSEGGESKHWRELPGNRVVEHLLQTDSDFDDVAAEWEEFTAEFAGTDDVYFINCLRVDKVDSPRNLERELYKTFNGVDFESLIEFYQENFPVRFAYDYFYKKFGLEQAVSNLLGARVDFSDVNELKSVIKQMLNLVLPASDNYILDEDFLYIKYDFFDQIEARLKRLSGHQTVKRIIEEMLVLALRSKIKAQYGKGFSLARRFLLRSSRPRPIDLVHQAKARFLELIAPFREKKEEEYLSQRYASMASKLLTEFAREVETEKVVLIQKVWRGRRERKKFRSALAAQKAAELERSREREREDQREVLSVLRANAKQSCLRNFLQVRRQMQLQIQRFMRQKLFKMELNRRILKKQKARLLSKMQKAEEVVVQSLCERLAHRASLRHPGSMRPTEVLNCPLILPPLRTQGVRERQLELRVALLNFHLVKPQELPTRFQENLAAVLNEIAREGDALLALNLLDEVTLIQTVRRKVHVFANYEAQSHVIVALPFKAHCVSYFNDFLYIVDEGFRLRLKYIPFEAPPADGPFRPQRTALVASDEESEATFVFAKFRDMVLKNGSFVGATDCDKLCVKTDLSDEFTEAKITQFRRKIARMGCGKRFFVVLDESGVLYAGGDNSRGQLGQGHVSPVEGIEPVRTLSYQKAIVKSFACGKHHTLAVTNNNQVFAWGCNLHGQVNPEFSSGSKVLIEAVDLPVRVLRSADLGCKGLHKLQVKAGKLSSYVLTSAGALFFFGTCSSRKSPRKVTKTSLSEIFGKDLWPVSLCVEWNARIELAYLRFVDGHSRGVAGKPRLKQTHRSLFLHFMLSPSGLIHFSPKFANQLDPAFLSNKVSQISNQRHHAILQKEKERTWNFMMFSSKLKG